MRTILISRRRRRDPRSVPTSISITAFKEELELGETFQFVAVVLDQNNEPVDGATVSWGSSDTNIATVSSGLVEAVGVGSVSISASYGGLTSSKVLEVEYGSISEIEVTPSILSIDANETEQFTAKAFNQFNKEIPDTPFTWSTSDPSVAVVDSGGLVEAYAGGSVDIVAAANGVTGSSALVVEGEVADVVASYDQILLLNPDVFVPLQLASYRGQQVLYKDSTFTDPVLDVGDPVGGVWDLAQDDEGAVAPSSSDRPIWQGVGDGVYTDEGDGVGDTLEISFPEKNVDNSLSIAVFVDISNSELVSPRIFAATAGEVSTFYSGSWFFVRNTGYPEQLRFSTPMPEGFAVVSTIFGAENEETVLRVEGVSASEVLPSADGVSVIGLAKYPTQSSSTRLNTKWLCIWHNHRLTESEMLTLEALND